MVYTEKNREYCKKYREKNIEKWREYDRIKHRNYDKKKCIWLKVLTELRRIDTNLFN